MTPLEKVLKAKKQILEEALQRIVGELAHDHMAPTSKARELFRIASFALAEADKHFLPKK